MSVASMLAVLIGFTLSIGWYFTHNWMLNNTLAMFLSLTFLKTIKMNTLVPGLVLLSLLFCYDIFWVFISPYFTSGGQSVMMAVATGLDIPIKIVMPHITSDHPSSACSLLGLGDILIPGIFITFMANFGYQIAKTPAYFYAGVTSYACALLTCGAFLWIFNAAQPALLYIVPFLFMAVFTVGLYRGEVGMLKEGISSNYEPPQQIQYLSHTFEESSGENT